jgi:hypothetical protein
LKTVELVLCLRSVRMIGLAIDRKNS